MPTCPIAVNHQEIGPTDFEDLMAGLMNMATHDLLVGDEGGTLAILEPKPEGAERHPIWTLAQIETPDQTGPGVVTWLQLSFAAQKEVLQDSAACAFGAVLVIPADPLRELENPEDFIARGVRYALCVSVTGESRLAHTAAREEAAVEWCDHGHIDQDYPLFPHLTAHGQALWGPAWAITQPEAP